MMIFPGDMVEVSYNRAMGPCYMYVDYREGCGGWFVPAVRVIGEFRRGIVVATITGGVSFVIDDRTNVFGWTYTSCLKRVTK